MIVWNENFVVFHGKNGFRGMMDVMAQKMCDLCSDIGTSKWVCRHGLQNGKGFEAGMPAITTFT